MGQMRCLFNQFSGAQRKQCFEHRVISWNQDTIPRHFLERARLSGEKQFVFQLGQEFTANFAISYCNDTEIKTKIQAANSSLPLVGRVRVGVAQAVVTAMNSYITSTCGATPTPALPTRGRVKNPESNFPRTLVRERGNDEVMRNRHPFTRKFEGSTNGSKLIRAAFGSLAITNSYVPASK
jgi:hypothetical protein